MNLQVYYPLRDDIKTYYNESEKIFIFDDPLCISVPEISIPEDLISIIKHFDTEQNYVTLTSRLFEKNIDHSEILINNIYSQLVYFGMILTPEVVSYRDKLENYINSDEKYTICAGSSFSDNKDILSQDLNNILKSNLKYNPRNAKAIIAPHIDFQLGKLSHNVYSPAFEAISESNCDLVVVLGTAHYKNSSYFMYTRKDYTSPLGKINTAKDILDKLESKVNVQYDDLAHFPEHSIELHFVLLQELFKNKKIEILPVLTGSIGELAKNKIYPENNIEYKEQISALKSVLEESGRNYIITSSGDLAHIGKKFGDDYDAFSKLNRLNIIDNKLISSLENMDKHAFYNQIAEINDENKICGLSPFYALLELLGDVKGKYLNYNQWYEKETQSAVSFCSIAYY